MNHPYFKVKWLLVQDDHAPDSLEYFDTQLAEKFGLTRKIFSEDGKQISNEDERSTIIFDKYALEYFADSPFYHLRYATEQERKLANE